MFLRSLLLPLYAVATLFPRLLTLPGLPAQVQVTELLFPLLLWSFRQELWTQVRRFPRYSWALAAYLGANLASAGWAGDAGAVEEALARVYLGILSFLVLANESCYGNGRLLAWWKWSTVAVSAGCLLVYGWVMLGGTTPAAMVARIAEYPYLGSVYRLRGTANVYGMLYLLLLPGLFLAYREWRQERGSGYPVLLMLVAGILTFGKENLLFPAGVLLLEAARYPRWATPLRLAALALVACLLLGTHLLVQRSGSELSEPGYTSGRTVLTLGRYHLDETNYVANKRAALLIGAAHPWLGVGPGQFQEYTEALVPSGRYPAHYGRFNPHSAWTGAFAETGFLGLLGLLALVAALFHSRPEQPNVFAAILLLFLVASVFKDVMNFRGLWVVVGLYLAAQATPARYHHPR